jgi:hypothetical protein
MRPGRTRPASVIRSGHRNGFGQRLHASVAWQKFQNRGSDTQNVFETNPNGDVVGWWTCGIRGAAIAGRTSPRIVTGSYVSNPIVHGIPPEITHLSIMVANQLLIGMILEVVCLSMKVWGRCLVEKNQDIHRLTSFLRRISQTEIEL